MQAPIKMNFLLFDTHYLILTTYYLLLTTNFLLLTTYNLPLTTYYFFSFSQTQLPIKLEAFSKKEYVAQGYLPAAVRRDEF